MTKAKYEPLDYYSEETEINDAVAYIQAARALDVAAQYAVESKDSETLAAVASLWIKMAENLGTPPESSDEDEVEVHEASKLGFIVGKEEND